MASYLTAKLVGEGFAKPDADNTLPIDIRYEKLGEWLVDRKQVPSDWSRRLQVIQARAAAAARELPPGFLGQLEGGADAPLDYFLARRVLERLGATAEKGLLGSYKGAAGEWDKLVRAYENSLLFVAEAAQALCRNADYEIPFLKKQAAKYQQQLADLERRKAEARKSAAAAAADFKQECAALGVEPGDIRGGLRRLTAGLPPLVEAAVRALQADGVAQSVAYYAAAAAAVGQAGEEEGEGGGEAGWGGELLPVLAEVREGRTAAPARPAMPPDEQQQQQQEEVEAAGAGLEVEWDLSAALEAVGGGGDAARDGPAPAAAISWDLDASELAADEQGEAAEAAEAAAPAEVSWEIDISGAGADVEAAAGGGNGGDAQPQAAAEEAAASVEEEEESAVVARLVEDAAYRAALSDDLLELRAFLKQRQRELGGRGGELLLAAAAPAQALVGADAAGAMLAAVEAALAQLGGDTLKHLIALRTSPRYVDRLVAGLQHRAAQEAKFQRAAADAELKRAEIQRQLVSDSAKLSALVKRTAAAKEAVESALGAKLGRRVNVMGEVNALLG